MSRPADIAGFGLPDLPTDDKVNRILTAALRGHSIQDRSLVEFQPIYWSADYFALEKVALFQAASGLEQQHILQRLNQELLTESLYIEQAGVGYMAKMVLMAESNQERMLYGLFAADEATHLAQLRPYVLCNGLQRPTDPFLQMLAEIVGCMDKAVLLFVLQVVLEGWGLTHYRRLAKGCREASLTHLFQSFLQAEARHHGTGVTLFDQGALSVGSQRDIVECLARFLQMVRVGPQRVVAAIAATKGHLSRPQRIQILQQLDTVAHSHQRLQLLKSLMAQTGDHIVSELEAKGLFIPLRPEEAASYG